MSRHEIKRTFRRTESINSSIDFIGGNNSDGSFWRMSIERAIEGLQLNKWSFYIVVNGHELDVVVQNIDNTPMLSIYFPEIGAININNIII